MCPGAPECYRAGPVPGPVQNRVVPGTATTATSSAPAAAAAGSDPGPARAPADCTISSGAGEALFIFYI